MGINIIWGFADIEEADGWNSSTPNHFENCLKFHPIQPHYSVVFFLSSSLACCFPFTYVAVNWKIGLKKYHKVSETGEEAQEKNSLIIQQQWTECSYMKARLLNECM